MSSNAQVYILYIISSSSIIFISKFFGQCCHTYLTLWMVFSPLFCTGWWRCVLSSIWATLTTRTTDWSMPHISLTVNWCSNLYSVQDGGGVPWAVPGQHWLPVPQTDQCPHISHTMNWCSTLYSVQGGGGVSWEVPGQHRLPVPVRCLANWAMSHSAEGTWAQNI